MFKDSPEGQTHSFGDGCIPPHVLPTANANTTKPARCCGEGSICRKCAPYFDTPEMTSTQGEVRLFQVCSCGVPCPMHPSPEAKVDKWEKEFASRFYARINNRVLDQDIESYIRSLLSQAREEQHRKCVEAVEKERKEADDHAGDLFSSGRLAGVKKALTALSAVQPKSSE